MKKASVSICVLLFSISLFSLDFEKKYNLKPKVDKKNGITWYVHKNDWGINSRVYIYIGKRNEDNKCSLRMRISYYAPRKLFIEEFIFTIDSEEHILIPREIIQTVEMRDSQLRRDSVETGDISRGICEIYDVLVNQEEFDLMQKLCNAKTVKLRYNGIKGFKRVKIHKSSRKAIKDVLNAFNELVKLSTQEKEE